MLVVSPVAPANSEQIGGTRTYTLGLIQALRRQGVRVGLAGLSGSDQAGYGLTVLDRADCGTLEFVWALLKQRRRLSAMGPSVIHLQLSIAALACLGLPYPLVITMHGAPMLGVARRRGRLAATAFLLLERIVLTRAASIIFVDTRSRDRYIQMFPWLETKLKTLPVAFDDTLFRPISALERAQIKLRWGLATANPIVIYVGRFSIEKGLDDALEAFKQLADQDSNAKFIMVGDGPEKTRLAAKIKWLDLQAKVEMLSGLNREGIAHLLNAADVFLLTSHHEGMPTAVIESLACGVPVIATDVGNVRQLLDEPQVGVVLDDRQSAGDTLVAYMRRLLEADQKRAIQARCASKVERFAWSHVVMDVLACYEQVLGDPRSEAIKS